jgi:acetylornithine deacetylase/succinyl-diaminopimelate desuccinylase-like protein
VLGELRTLLALPNVASDAANIRRNADLLVRMLASRGVAARLLEAEGSPPAVYGELKVPGATRTVVLYAHYDGQPVTPADWASEPWKPVLRDGPLGPGVRELPWPKPGERTGGEWRVFARSASDDKAPIVAMLAALDALKAAGVTPSVNVKFFLEGEEEAGSPHLRAMLEGHREALAADGWLFSDGPVHQSRRMQVLFGVRGTLGLEATVYGPSRALHSGHYGNWAPNPNVLLAHLLASLRDTEGRILVPGFSDDVRPLSAAERAALARLPPVDAALREELALGRTEGRGAPLAERIAEPALNVRGLSGGAVGETAANVIPTRAQASIDFRLVPDQRPERVRQKVERFLAQKGWHVVHAEPDAALLKAHPRVVRLEWEGGYPATRTRMDAPLSRAVARVAEQTLGAPPLLVPTLGGSLPMYLFAEVLGAPLVVLPVVNHDNAQHAANENLRLQNLWDAIELYAGLLGRLGAEWR